MQIRFTSIPRLRRRSFWLLGTLAWGVFYAVREGLDLEQHPATATAWAGVALFVIGALTVARLHDRNRSGWWLAVVLLPIVGALWLVWEAALRRGTPEANAYGPDPRNQ